VPSKNEHKKKCATHHEQHTLYINSPILCQKVFF